MSGQEYAWPDFLLACYGRRLADPTRRGSDTGGFLFCTLFLLIPALYGTAPDGPAIQIRPADRISPTGTVRPTPPRPDQPVPCCFCTDLPHRSQRPLTPAFWSSNPGRSRLYRSDRPRIRMPFYYQQTGQYRHHPVVCALCGCVVIVA